MQDSLDSGKASVSAFTLTEMLVSMAVLSALILLLFWVVDGTTKAWNQSELRVDSFREARAALFIIARDLQTMVPAPDILTTSLLPADPNYSKPDGIPDFNYFFVYRYSTDTTLHPEITFSGVTGIGDLASTAGGAKGEGDRLFFLTAESVAAQGNVVKSDVCSVGYYLAYTKSVTTADPTFKLYRYFRNSNDTYDKAGTENDLKGFTSKTSTVLMDASNIASGDEVLARNVVDFRIIPYSNANLTSATSMTAPQAWSSNTTPYAVDISITAYNYSAASRFTDRSDWMALTTAKNAPSRQTFSTRVYLPRH